MTKKSITHIKRNSVLIFLFLTIIISAIPNYYIIQTGSIKAGGGLFVFIVMWSPGISAILTLLLTRQSLKTIKWNLGKLKYILSAYLVPMLYVSLAYIPLWLIGFYNTEKELTLKSIAIPLLGVFVNIIAVLGEEIGWRGFLFPKLEKKMSFTKSALITGFIWAIWHTPALLFTEYGSEAPWYTALPFFVITLTAISLPMSYLCKKANSFWPAVLFHAAHNAFIQAFYDPFTIKNEISIYLIGETGLSLVIVSLIMLFIFHKESKAYC